MKQPCSANTAELKHIIGDKGIRLLFLYHALLGGRA